MKQGYKHRPQDFKRRTIQKVYSNKLELHDAEHKWLSMIKQEELRVRYYNLRNHHFSHWTSDPDKLLTIGQKISKANTGKKHGPKTEEAKRKISEKNKGRIFTEEHRRRLGQAKAGKALTKEHREKIGQALVGRIGHTKGRQLSEKHKYKVSVALKGKPKKPFTEEHRKNIGEANRRKPRRTMTEEHKRKIGESNRLRWEARLRI